MTLSNIPNQPDPLFPDKEDLFADAKFKPKKVPPDLNRMGVDRNVFKNQPGKVGRRRTASMFVEGKLSWGAAELGSGLAPVYTLKEDHSHGYPSLYKLYMEMADPTEYLFAQEAFGSWEHWLEILGGDIDGPFPAWIREYIMKWRKELEIKLRAEGIRSLRTHAKTKPAAALYFADGQFSVHNIKRGRGRPKKEDTEQQLLMEKLAAKELDEDMSRLDI